VIAIDTNILIRTIVDDPTSPQQCLEARQIIQDYDMIFISNIVIIETVWVLRRSYNFSKNEITETISKVIAHSAFVFEDNNSLESALNLFKRNPIGFSDCLIFSIAQSRNLKLITFDRKLNSVIRTEHK
jgi:predicted nucleic-acid-binding protein